MAIVRDNPMTELLVAPEKQEASPPASAPLERLQVPVPGVLADADERLDAHKVKP